MSIEQISSSPSSVSSLVPSPLPVVVNSPPSLLRCLSSAPQNLETPLSSTLPSPGWAGPELPAEFTPISIVTNNPPIVSIDVPLYAYRLHTDFPDTHILERMTNFL